MEAHHLVLDRNFGGTFTNEAASNNTPPTAGGRNAIKHGECHQNTHARDSSFSLHVCICGVKFSRLDALNRHIKSKSNGIPMYPCHGCDRHQGMNGFHRRDHLVQHQKSCSKRNIEKELHGQRAGFTPAAVAPGPSVLLSGDAISSDQLPTIACPIPGCNRYGMDGFLRLRDLNDHQRWEHSTTTQNPGTSMLYGTQFAQPIHDPQVNQSGYAQLYQRYGTSLAYQQGGASQQPIYDPELCWTNTALQYGQYSAPQLF
ncbi:hypothetical protein F5B19DRAFT_497336 [Rostrohypoxylon terebratum]|nr:hypothetical protein F5B19DRAFT_497336 [Rostrohypoxylon terebratum]